MSTYWGYKCKDCNVSSEHWFNHGDDYLNALVAVREDLEQVMKRLEKWIGWRIDISHMNVDEENPLEFLQQHKGHNIVLENEYGDLKELTEVIMKHYSEYETIDEFREFVKKNPKHLLCSPWKQMLEDMDLGQEYDVDDFIEEGEYHENGH